MLCVKITLMGTCTSTGRSVLLIKGPCPTWDAFTIIQSLGLNLDFGEATPETRACVYFIRPSESPVVDHAFPTLFLYTGRLPTIACTGPCKVLEASELQQGLKWLALKI